MHEAKECNIKVNELSRSIMCILLKLMYRKGIKEHVKEKNLNVFRNQWKQDSQLNHFTRYNNKYSAIA